MLRDNFKTLGKLDIVLTDPSGIVKESKHVPNLVVQTGKNYIAHRMTGSGNAVMSHMAIGSGSATASLADIALDTEEARVIFSSSATNANVITYIATFPAGVPSEPVPTVPIREAGIFNSISAGEMLCRTTFDVVNKGIQDTLTITWTVSNN